MPNNRLIDFEQHLKQIQSSVSLLKNKLDNLHLAYNQTSSQGLTKQAQEITKEIETVSGNIDLLDQQRSDIESQIVQISQLTEPHQNSTHSNSHGSTHTKSTEEDTNEATDEPAPQSPTPTVAPPTTITPQIKPKVLTPKQIKKQLKTNLASGNIKKNLRLIRQSGSIRVKTSTAPSQPITNQTSTQNTINSTATTPTNKNPSATSQNDNQASTTTAIPPVPHATQTDIQMNPLEPIAKTGGISGLVQSLRNLSKIGKGFAPQGVILSKFNSILRKLTAGGTLLLTGLLMYLAYLGKAALMGGLIGGAIGAAAGGVFGAYMGLQVAALFGPFAPLVAIVTVPTFAAAGAVTGALIGAAAGGLIGLGIASGSATLTSMGVGTGIGAGIGAWAGFALGGVISGAFISLAAAACAATLIGCVLVPIAAVSSPLIIATTTALGAIAGAFIGGAVGYVVGEYVLDPIKNFYTKSITKISTGVNGVSVGNWFSGFGNTIGGALSATANVVTGLVSTLWGGTVSIASSALGWLGGVASHAFGLASTLATSVSSVAAIGVGGTVATLSVGTILVAGTQMVALSTSEGDLSEAPSGLPPGENDLFIVTKTANPTQITNPNVLETKNITFTIKVTPKNQSITNILLVDNLRFRHGSDPETPLSPPPGTSFVCTNLPLTPASPCTIIFNQPINVTHSDSVVTNTIYAETSLPDGSKKTATATVTVQVGAPGGNCPTGWPITGNVTQGPEGATSHADSVYGGYEALDIGAPVGTPVYSTLDGTINYADNSRGALDQRMGLTPTGCTNSNLKLVHFWHLSAMNFRLGQIVRKGDIVGLSGHVAPHLHYQFNGEPNLATGDRTFRQEPPNIPTSVPRTCNSPGECNVKTTAP
jgi:hypothetical protein